MTKVTKKDEQQLTVNGEKISYVAIVNTLRRQGQLANVLKEVILEKALSGIEIPIEEEDMLLAKYKENNKLHNEEQYKLYLTKCLLNESLLRQMIVRSKKIVRFEEERWGTRVNSLYLANKEQFDLITYHQLSSTNQDVMQEVYFRLKDKEESWERMSKQFSKGKEDFKSETGPVEAINIDKNIMKEMRYKGIGKVCRPIKAGQNYAVIELINIQPRKFNDELKFEILRNEFENWLTEEYNQSIKSVSFPGQ